MKIWFKLNKEFKSCMQECPKYDEKIEKDCHKKCDKIYEKYPLALYDRYKDHEEKLYQEVEDSQIFTTKQREDRKGLFYRLFGNYYT